MLASAGASTSTQPGARHLEPDFGPADAEARRPTADDSESIARATVARNHPEAAATIERARDAASAPRTRRGMGHRSVGIQDCRRQAGGGGITGNACERWNQSAATTWVPWMMLGVYC
ncbi:hypothetical protein RJ55_04253 [Drechmeria coniospora]|nr:hypothetical protein RJ55_04253 [Drechmeria coniospora]